MKHHYMPQFLLTPWRAADGKVHACYRGPRGALRDARWSPRSTGFVHELYRQDPTLRGMAAGAWEEQNAVETKGYAKLDSDAARVRDRLLAGTPPSQLTEAERTQWAEFIATLEHRTPRKIASLDGHAAEIVKTVEREFLALGPEVQHRQEILGQIDLDALARNVARSLPVARRRELAEGVRTLTWMCTKVDSGIEFITTDYPIASFDHEEGRVGFVLPLSPGMLFMAMAERWEDVSPRTAFMTILAVNLQLIYQRPNFVYSRSRLADGPVFRLRKAAEEFLPTPEPFGPPGDRGPT